MPLRPPLLLLRLLLLLLLALPVSLALLPKVLLPPLPPPPPYYCTSGAAIAAPPIPASAAATSTAAAATTASNPRSTCSTSDYRRPRQHHRFNQSCSLWRELRRPRCIKPRKHGRAPRSHVCARAPVPLTLRPQNAKCRSLCRHHGSSLPCLQRARQTRQVLQTPSLFAVLNQAHWTSLEKAAVVEGTGDHVAASGCFCCWWVRALASPQA